MRNSHNITFTRSDAFIVDDDTTSSLPGGGGRLCVVATGIGESLFCFMALIRCFSFFILGPFSSR
ncbi:Inner membrane protein ygbE [Salmonella enterica subsp. arizonae]|uniref:Inner membrane protein ygbE n=1 Tax=Salmonella enterica subsp. arizonae TaxID=59203 RepID=A0A379RZK9_SALER|nr:Inner membrane protein ygbE [Salmonella enterica subsp. arizonae]